jgi:hypothetical protein
LRRSYFERDLYGSNAGVFWGCVRYCGVEIPHFIDFTVKNDFITHSE